jgi:tRNA pseudouridine38-40 synthase
MGQLFRLGRGEIGLEDIRQSLENPDEDTFDYIAPASGLMLNKVNFE